MAKTVLFTGGTGFIGSHLADFLEQQGFDIVLYTKKTFVPAAYKKISTLQEIKDLPELLAVINLAGAPIDGKRWTDKYQKILYDSRAKTTNDLILHLRKYQNLPKTFISASAVGYYLGHQWACSEDTAVSDSPSFSRDLCRAWEGCANSIANDGVGVALMRIAPVLSPQGGLLKKAEMPFKIGLGTIFGEGNQLMPWIHLGDCINAFWHVLKNGLDGPFNLVAPAACTNKEFSTTLAGQFGKKPLMHLPPAIVRALFGKVADETILAGIHVTPERLLANGFAFKYPNIEGALASFYGTCG